MQTESHIWYLVPGSVAEPDKMQATQRIKERGQATWRSQVHCVFINAFTLLFGWQETCGL